MHKKEVIIAGKKISDAKKALVMLHGRGASAGDIMTLGNYLNVKDHAWFVPQATNHTWYPYSFLAPSQQNEPWLSSAIALLNEIVTDIQQSGIATEQIYFVGFSQGACLTLEYVTRHARRWGGVAAFTGGLIGDKINPSIYHGDFMQTPVFIGSSDPDPHVPVDRVLDSATLLRSMHASVTEKIYPNMGHTVAMEEIEAANKLIFI